MLDGVVLAAGGSGDSLSIRVADLKGIVATGFGRREFIVPVVLVLEASCRSSRKRVAIDDSSWKSGPPTLQRVSTTAHLGVIEWLGEPPVGVLSALRRPEVLAQVLARGL